MGKNSSLQGRIWSWMANDSASVIFGLICLTCTAVYGSEVAAGLGVGAREGRSFENVKPATTCNARTHNACRKWRTMPIGPRRKGSSPESGSYNDAVPAQISQDLAPSGVSSSLSTLRLLFLALVRKWRKAPPFPMELFLLLPFLLFFCPLMYSLVSSREPLLPCCVLLLLSRIRHHT